MTDVFISYARKDQPVARWLAESLERDGLQVWWDPEIVPGEQFNDSIRENLTTAGCVIVIWSRASANSIWVRAEASTALERDCLIPVSIGTVKPPLPFDQIQTVDFTGWRGDPAHSAYQELLQAIRGRLGRLREQEEQGSQPRPEVDTQRFSVVVARVQNDIGQQLQDVIAADLSEFEGIHVVTFDKTLTSEGQSPEEGLRAAQQKSRDYLDEMGATVMIWGKILRFGGKEIPQLYLTVSRSKTQRRGRYVPTDELRLPQLFWTDLADILRLVILTYDADFREQEGFYLGDQLRPFITRVRRLLQRADQTHGWSDDTRGLARINVADALMLLGNQSGENEAIEEAIENYRKALTELTRERSPRDWARAQNGLGISLWLLGSRNGDIGLLKDAIAAYRSSLEERRREHEPLDWAQSWNDLGNTLTTLGQQESGTKRLEEAVHAYETALLERTITANPLDWAQTMNNLGVVLWQLGQRESEKKHLEKAITALESSFEVYTREMTPLDWSQTQNNLGLVLWTLGNREASSERLTKAVEAYREALRERKRQQVPLLWAQTQNNHGLALLSLGQLTNNPRRLEQAVQAFQHALSERTRERSPMDWAQTQNNLGAALWSLGRLNDTTEELEEAVQAYRNALSVYTRDDEALEWAQTRHNLANALAILGEREEDNARLEEALEMLRAALREYDRNQEPMPWAQTLGDLGYVANLLGERLSDAELLSEAAEAFEASKEVYEQAGMEERARSFDEKIRSVKSLLGQLHQ